MATLSPLPIIQQLDSNGKPYAGGLLYTYEAGTTNPKDTFTDFNAGTANSNPVILDSDGRANVWLEGGAYKFILTDGSNASVYDTSVVEGNIVWTVDDINAAESGVTLNIVDKYADLADLATGDSAVAIIRGYNTAYDGGYGVYAYDTDTSEWTLLYNGDIDVRWFGAKGTGTDNDSAAFVSANAFAASVQRGLVCYAGTYLLTTDPVLTQAVELKSDAILKWSGFDFRINPLIPISDTSRHFNYDSENERPLFPTGADIRQVWLDGVSTIVITDNGGTWASGKVTVIVNTVNDYIQDFDTDKDNSMSALAELIADDVAVNTAVYDRDLHTITITSNPEYQLVIEAVLAITPDTMLFEINGDGWYQHSLSTQRDMLVAQLDVVNLKGAVGKNIYITDYVVTITDDNGTWTSGTAIVTVNAISYKQVWGTDKDTSMTALAAQIESNEVVLTAVYDSGSRTILITPVAGIFLAVTSDLTMMVGTMTFEIVTGGTWDSGNVVVMVNNRTYTQTWDTDKTTSLEALATKISADPDIDTAVYDIEFGYYIKVVPLTGKALYITADVSDITGSMILTPMDVDRKEINELLYNSITSQSSFFIATFPNSQPLTINYTLFDDGHVKWSWEDFTGMESVDAHTAADTPVPGALRPDYIRYCLLFSSTMNDDYLDIAHIVADVLAVFIIEPSGKLTISSYNQDSVGIRSGSCEYWL